MKDNSPKKILAIIPAHNEEQQIGQVIQSIRSALDTIDILVIDDGSADTTVSCSRLNGAKVISLSTHMGYGVALQTGYKYAFENGYDYLVQLDGDGQHDPTYIPKMLDVVMSENADLILGSRFLQKGMPRNIDLLEYIPGIARKFGIKLFAILTSMLVGFKITDPTSGYQAFNKGVITFFTHDFFPCDYPDADVIVMTHRAGFTIKELPMVIYANTNGTTMHNGLKPLYYTFKMFLSLSMTLLRKSPVL